MPTTIKYSNNPNSDTAFVIQDGGQKNRTVLTAEPAGTLQLSDSANVSTGYVTDEDGKKHKVNLVAQLEGDIEFSENPNSTKGYATVDGKKHRVVLTASLHGGGGSAPVIDELNVTPSTSAQTITAPEGTDGYSPVNVAAVTNAIDANIVAGNIKKDVSILGVTGSYEGVVPSGTKTIIINGTYDVAGYANADVQVPTTAPDMYIAYNLSSAGVLSKGTSVLDFSVIKDVAASCLKDAFANNTSFTGMLDFSSLEGLSGSYGIYGAFQNCTNLTSLNLSALTTITGTAAAQNAFQGCTGITSVDLGSLTTVSGSYALNSAFKGDTSLTSVDLSNLTTVSGSYAFQYAFQNCTGAWSSAFDLSALSSVTGSYAFSYAFAGSAITGIDLSSLVNVTANNSFEYAFSGCSSLTSINLSNLTSIGGTDSCQYMFQGCTSLTSVTLEKLTSVSGSIFRMFYGCSGLVTANLESLDNITGAANNLFTNCTNLTSCDLSCLRYIDTNATWAFAGAFERASSLQEMRFYSLYRTKGYRVMQSPFGWATSLRHVYFYALREDQVMATDNFYQLVNYVDGCTIHFPKNFDPNNGGTLVPTLATYPNFGGTNTIIAYDLPSTYILTGADTVQYERSPKYDTTTSLAWRVLGTIVKSTTYYTSTTNDPQVGDTIYSDSACTTAVTTISSIA